MGLTPHEIRTLIVIERVTASISVLATFLLVGTFIFIKQFRTLSNTLIFYASFANIFANVAALIGGSALSHESGALCQFQGFLLEMFMQSDPMWSCAMAVNVYLVFFRRYDAQRLKKLYWIYGIICYGLPFIPAMFCLFYKTHAKGKMYGNATLWCWIDNDWAPIRIYSYYAPIWVAILTTFIIYLRVGVEIFQKRSELRAAGCEYNQTAASGIAPGTLDSFCGDGKTASPFTGLRTTEIKVTTHQLTTPSSLEGPIACPSPTAITTSQQQQHLREKSLPAIHPISPSPTPSKEQYSITITSPRSPPSYSLPQSSSSSPAADGSGSGARVGVSSRARAMFPRRPSSMDRIKWAYTKCALLFAISILITWVPASVNRVYGLRYPHDPSFALNVCSALVLPLQGFWNTLIYFVTSLSICRGVWEGWMEKRRRNTGGEERVWKMELGKWIGKGKGDRIKRASGGGGSKELDVERSDSMVELSKKRSGSLGDADTDSF